MSPTIFGEMWDGELEALEMLWRMQQRRLNEHFSASYLEQLDNEKAKLWSQPNEPTLDELLPHTSPEARMASDFLNGCTELGSSRTGMLTEPLTVSFSKGAGGKISRKPSSLWSTPPRQAESRTLPSD